MFVAVCSAALLTCTRAPSAPSAAPKRFIAGESETPRVRGRVNFESRPVLWTSEGVALVERPKDTLPEEGPLELRLLLPEALRGAPEVALETTLQAGVGRLETHSIPPIHLTGPQLAATGPVEVNVPLPESLRGQVATVSVVGWPLGDSTVTSHRTHPVEVPAESKLEFGYAIAQAGWSPEWPPTDFRVWAEDPAGTAPPELIFEGRLDPAERAEDRAWMDGDVPLDDLAGRDVVFRIEAEADPGDGAAIARSLPLVSNPEMVPQNPPAPARPNVLLVSLDTLRSRSINAYGYERETMPALRKRFVEQGAMVRSVVTPFPHTTPGHMSIMTGLEPCAHGVLTGDARLATGVATLAETLRAAGYRTAAFTEDGAMADGLGYERGFDQYREFPPNERLGQAVDVFSAAAKWMDAPSSRPFFAFVHTYEVHGPYVPPEGYETFFDDPRKDKWSQNRLLYDREIRYVDDVLDDLVDDVDASHPDTLIVVTADHGEEFNEHGHFGHGYALYDESILVPLFFRWPGHIPPGTAIEGQVGLIDVAPTVLDLLDLPGLDVAQGRAFGEALLGKGEALSALPLRSEDRRGHEAVRTETYKYYRRGDQELLFDLRADPEETNDVLQKNPALAAEARVALSGARKRCEQWREIHPELRAAEAKAGTLAEVVGKLRALGYVE